MGFSKNNNNKGPILDQQKDVYLFFRRDESRCCAAGKPVSSKNKDTSFYWSRAPPIYENEMAKFTKKLITKN